MDFKLSLFTVFCLTDDWPNRVDHRQYARVYRCRWLPDWSIYGNQRTRKMLFACMLVPAFNRLESSPSQSVNRQIHETEAA